MTKVRVTFALRCEILGASIGIAGLLFWLGRWAGLGLFALVAPLLAVVFLPIVGEILAMTLGPRIHRSCPGHWFVDRDAQARRKMDEFLDDTEDNPTIR